MSEKPLTYFGEWHTMDSCPFAELAAYNEDKLCALILVTDGKKTALISAETRYGASIGRKDWGWALVDELDDGDDRFGKDEIDFDPTHWTRLPVCPQDIPGTCRG